MSGLSVSPHFTVNIDLKNHFLGPRFEGIVSGEFFTWPFVFEAVVSSVTHWLWVALLSLYLSSIVNCSKCAALIRADWCGSILSVSEWEDASAALDQSADSLIKLGAKCTFILPAPPHLFEIEPTEPVKKEKRKKSTCNWRSCKHQLVILEINT